MNCQDFLAQGYTLIEQGLDSDDVQLLEQSHSDLSARAAQIIAHCAAENISFADYYREHPKDLIAVPERDEPSQVCRYEYIQHCDRNVRERLIPKLQRYIQELTGESFVLFKDKCNAKNPGGGAFKPHQDVIAYDKFAPNYHVTAAIFLDAATLENGCLHFPRDYRQALAEFDFPQIKTPVGELAILPSCVGGSDHGNIDPEVERQIEWEPIVAAPGDVVLFDSYVPHYSHANLSNYKRRAMFFTFNPASQGEHYDAYYAMKHREFDNPAFHIATPTEHQLS